MDDLEMKPLKIELESDFALCCGLTIESTCLGVMNCALADVSHDSRTIACS